MYPLILSIAGALIIILLGIIGYLYSTQNSSQREEAKVLSKSISELTMTIQGLNAILLVLEEKHNNLERRFDEHKLACNDKFKNFQ